jgi:glycosyltransferase involved in cell wall biosynthesis
VRRKRVAVVAPVYNEAGGIAPFTDAVREALRPLPYDYTIVLVDDGSTDGTAEILDRLHDDDPQHVTTIHLSRNFGHQGALTAGMDHAQGDAVICLDADMQHPPSLIPKLLERWEEGFDVVHAVRRETSDGPFKDLTARAFYALINRLSETPIEPNAADFRLLSRKVVEVFRKDLRERDRFVRGLVGWVGFRSCRVEFDAGRRLAGRSKYSLGKMLHFARTGIVSFSKIPLKVAALVGFAVSLLSALYGIFAVGAYLFFQRAVIPGWASTILVGTFLGGCQLLFLGLIGEYVATIFDEIKARPLYLVADARFAEPRSSDAVDAADPPA